MGNVIIIAALVLIIGIAVFYLTHRLLFGLGAYFVSVFCIPVLLIALNDSGRKDQERQSGELSDYIGRMEAYINDREADPTWYTNELDRIAAKRMSLGIASSTVEALGSYEWPLSAEEAGTLKRLSADISSDAQSWRELTLGIVERSCGAARERISQTCDEISLMPNAIPNALELAAVVENGYADDVKEAMLSVVEEGSGWAAQIAGVRVAGKTGTAETSSTTANSLFVGFAPYDQPTLAISICVEGSANTEVNGVATQLAGQVLATCLNIQAWGA